MQPTLHVSARLWSTILHNAAQHCPFLIRRDQQHKVGTHTSVSTFPLIQLVSLSCPTHYQRNLHRYKPHSPSLNFHSNNVHPSESTVKFNSPFNPNVPFYRSSCLRTGLSLNNHQQLSISTASCHLRLPCIS